MPQIVITVQVDDVRDWDGWRARRVNAIVQAGGSNVVEHVAAPADPAPGGGASDGIETVAITLTVQNMKKARALITAANDAAADPLMLRHGITGVPVVYVEGHVV